MSGGKARLGGAKAPQVTREDLDDNIKTYRPEDDGRGAEERVRYIRFDRIEPSPFQVRRVFPESEIEQLADSIRDSGLVHPPKARPHPTKPKWVELMPGEMRVRALRKLTERGEAEGVLKRDHDGEWLAPVVIVDVDDERAEAVVFAENEARTDLSPWEWAFAWQQRRDRRKERGQPATVRDVAAAHKRPHTTVGEYLRVADQISRDVLKRAGLVGLDGEPEHARMAKVPFTDLKGVATTVADHGAGHGAARLRRALQRIEGAPKQEAKTQSASFQINIRRPLDQLTPDQAAHYLGRISEALPTLADRAAEKIAPERATALVASLERVVDVLRSEP